ncbi:MAG: MFS transporter, partial [Cyanobacteria bacterium J06642_11]
LNQSRHGRMMALWNLAGSSGSVLGPLVLAGAIAIGQGWQQALLLLAGLSGLVLVWLWRMPMLVNRPPSSTGGVFHGLGSAIAALKQPSIVRWLILVQVSDLMLDGFQGYVALYFVDVMGTSATKASVVMTFWLGVGFLGDLLLIPLLENVRGFTYLKVSSMLVLFLYPAFLLVPWLSAKYILLGGLGLLSAGWYSILKGQLYTAMPGQSGAVITLSNLFGLVGSLMPLLLGFLALKIGLESTLWVLVIAPVVLLIGTAL